MGKRRRLLARVAAATATLTSLVGCGFLIASSTPPNEREGGVDAQSAFEAATSDGGIQCFVPSRPNFVPAGWELYEPFPCCGIYVPSAPNFLPPPIQWKPCEADAGDGVDCREMSNAVGAPEWGVSIHDGGVSLEAFEPIGDGGAIVVAEADGPVHQAIMSTDSFCGGLFLGDVGGGKFSLDFYFGASTTPSYVVAGDVDDFRPSLVAKLEDGGSDIAVGSLGLLEMAYPEFRLYSWQDPGRYTTLGGMVGYWPAFTTDAIFWSAGDGQEVRTYTSAGGMSTLFTAPGEYTQYAADLGADDHDLVWVEGQNWDQSKEMYSTAAYYTSPYTTNPSALGHRRLTSETPIGVGDSYTKVGCGYAVRLSGNDGIRVVRISDGTSWILSRDPPGYGFVEPLGVTCDEVFAWIGIGAGGVSIARVRIDSLGPGIPAN